MSRPRTFDPGILLIVLSVAILGGTGWVLYNNLRTDEITARVESGEMIRALLVVEEDGAPLLSEVLFYNPNSDRLAMFDIPRNLGAILDEVDRVDRLSVLYEEERYNAYRQELSELLGVSIPYYLFMDMEQLGNVVDLLGGVEVFISDSFSPSDSEENGDVPLLPSGTVTLDGAKIRSYLSYSAPQEGTIERVSRHQEFLQSLVSELGRHSSYVSDPEVTEYLGRYMDTNLDSRALVALVQELSDLDSGTVITRRVQGTLREVDVSGETSELLFPHFEGQWLRQTVRQVEQSLAGTAGGTIPHRSIAVQILNGTLRNGLASRTQALYEGYGFNVVAIGNAPEQDRDQTVVLSHGDTTTAAQQVAEVIRAQQVNQQEEPPVTAGDYNGTIDVTLILGEDFEGTYVR